MARKIRMWVETGFAGAKHEDFADLPEGWDEMTEDEREKELDEFAIEFRNNCIEYGASVVDDEEPKSRRR